MKDYDRISMVFLDHYFIFATDCAICLIHNDFLSRSLSLARSIIVGNYDIAMPTLSFPYLYCIYAVFLKVAVRLSRNTERALAMSMTQCVGESKK